MRGNIHHLCYILALALMAFSVQTGFGDSVEHEGTCFWVSGDTKNHSDAVQACRDIGGALVQLNKHETFDVITHKLPADKQFWVGLVSGSKETNDGKGFYWESKESPRSDQWIPGEPNETGFCVRLTSSYGEQALHHHLLADNPCTSQYNYICQKPYAFGDCDIGRGHRQKVNGSSLCPVRSSPADGNIDCAVSCTLNSNCVSYNFNTASSTCTLFRTSYTCDVALENEFEATIIERYCHWDVPNSV